ncbi:MAG: rod shape-determining protein MreC [Clostridia bacterium]|nr:rod shape-determining protein MreC [Clostridia bacterium]
MRFFFRSRRFKIILAIVLASALSFGIFGIATGLSAPQSNIMGAVLKPIQQGCANISNWFDSVFVNFESNQKLSQENQELKKQLADKNYQLVEYEDVVRQNKFYKDFLEIKENNPSYKFSPAMVIARDTTDPYGTFTINKGILDGVSVYDPVITADGLVGYISDAYSNQSVVMTVLNPSINITALDNRTRDSGNITGDADLAVKGMCKMTYLAKSSSLAAGDFIISSGAGGVFPAGQIIGTVKEVKTSANATDYYAVVQPSVDVFDIADVMVVTSFEGKSSISK